MSAHKPIGIVGLGQIGSGMAERLVRRGYAVLGYDIAARAREKAASIGVRNAAGLGELVVECDTILTSLSSVSAIEQTYLGAGGLASSKSKGLLAIECSTIAPTIARRITETMHANGHMAIEASVIGQHREAVAGTLFFVVSGSAQAVSRAHDILGALGRGHVHIGPSGTAAAAKLINNAIGAVAICAIAEALTLARDLEIDPTAFVQLVNEGQGAGSSVVFERHAKHMANWAQSTRSPTPIALKDSIGLAELVGDRQCAFPLMSGMVALYDELLHEAPRPQAEMLAERADQRLAALSKKNKP